MNITWSREQRKRSKDEGKGLFAAGFDANGGYMKIHGLMSHELCAKAVLFVHHLYKTKSPIKAFQEAFPGVEVRTEKEQKKK